MALLLSAFLCTEVEGLGERPTPESCAPPPWAPPAYGGWRHGGTRRLRLYLFRTHPPVLPPLWSWPPAGELPGAAEGTTAEGGGLWASPIENNVDWRPALRNTGRSCRNDGVAGAPVLLHPAGHACAPYPVSVRGAELCGVQKPPTPHPNTQMG